MLDHIKKYYNWRSWFLSELKKIFNILYLKLPAYNVGENLLKKKIKIFLQNFIKILNQYYWFKYVVIIFILMWLYEPRYFSRYLISFLILVVLLVYRYIYWLTEKYFLEISNFFLHFTLLNHLFINFILIININVWLYYIQQFFILFLKIIRFILMKFKLHFFMMWFDKFFYFLINIYFILIFKKIEKFISNLRIKILKKNFNEIISWRLFILFINIIILQQIINYFELNIDYIQILKVIFFLFFFYLIDQSILKILKDYHTNSEFYYILDNDGKNLHYKYNSNYMIWVEFISIRGGMFESKFYKNNVTIISKCLNLKEEGYTGSFFREKFIDIDNNKKLKPFNGVDLYDRYWLNRELYYSDIIFGINIEIINKLFFYINRSNFISILLYYKWLKNFAFKKYNEIENFYIQNDYQMSLDYKIKHPFLNKDSNNTKQMHTDIQELSSDIIYIYKKYQNLELMLNEIFIDLDSLLNLNGQNLEIGLNLLLNNYLVIDLEAYDQYVWLDYNLKNEKIKYTNYLKKKNKEKILLKKIYKFNNLLNYEKKNINNYVNMLSKKKKNSVFFLDDSAISSIFTLKVGFYKLVKGDNPDVSVDVYDQEDVQIFLSEDARYIDAINYDVQDPGGGHDPEYWFYKKEFFVNMDINKVESVLLDEYNKFLVDKVKLKKNIGLNKKIKKYKEYNYRIGY